MDIKKRYLFGDYFMKDTQQINIDPLEQLRAIKANDDQALRQLYLLNYPKVEKFITGNNGTTDQAKDIFQEAFIAVWRNIQLDKIKLGSLNDLSGYLFQVAKYKWLDYLRSGHYKNTTAFNGQTDGVEIEVLPNEENEYITAIKKNFGLLGQNCQEVLKSFYYEKTPLKVIAVKLGWTEATARNNKYRCLERLRDLLKQHKH